MGAVAVLLADLGIVAPVASAGPAAGPGAAPSARPSAPAGAVASAPAAPGAAPGPSPPPAAAAGEPEVPPGVYRYTTSGYEEVDVLGGARHDYPQTTTVTYSRSGCGVQERWQPLEGRVGSAVQCAGDAGSVLRSTYQEREFFGQSQTKTYTCDPGVLLRPRDPQPGQGWTGRCTSGDSTASFAGRVVALEELDVGGTRVPVVRVLLRGTLTGSTRGRSDREVWLARSDGLLVQATGDTDTEADTSGGTVRYRETYRLRLQSLTPRR